MEAHRMDRILVVEDTEANIDIIVDTLSPEYELSIEMDGESGLDAVQTVNPDLILLDIMMPGIDGYEVCRQLKQNVATRDIPVIFLTALMSIQDEARGLQLGAVDYITKPFNPEIMKTRVKIHLELSHNRLALQEQRDEIEDNYRQLQELENLRDDLVNMIVHDMRSPVIGICGHLEFALQELRKAEPKSQVVSDLDTALRSGYMMSDMVTSLLDISRFESGKMPLRVEPCDLLKLAAGAAERLGRPARNCRVEVTAGALEAVDAECDAALVQRVVMNLVGNALRYSPDGGLVQVVVAQEPQWVRISVRDEGPGIPPEYQDKIFQKFTQVEGDILAGSQTSGLGLTFCKLAVDAHGGSIQIESSDQHGTTFHVRLPVATKGGVKGAVLEDHAWDDLTSEPELSEQVKILLVDDSKTVTDTLTRYLKMHSDWEVTAINQAERTVRVARKLQPDLILLDVNMPGMMGSEVAEALGHYPELQRCQIAYHTELISPEEVNADTLQCYGKHPVIPKSLPLARIHTMIFELLLLGMTKAQS
jgi:two-component system, sensor histidine kinase and response regulator